MIQDVLTKKLLQFYTSEIFQILFLEGVASHSNRTEVLFHQYESKFAGNLSYLKKHWNP